jgi:hypothetical protein
VIAPINNLEFRWRRFRRPQWPIAILDPGEKCLHAEILPLGDRVELVVMAAGTADTQAEKRLGGVHDNFVQGILPCQPLRRIVGTDLPRK